MGGNTEYLPGSDHLVHLRLVAAFAGLRKAMNHVLVQGAVDPLVRLVFEGGGFARMHDVVLRSLPD
jgi:hypothetical protein